ncbi:TonB-dependent receptor [Yeosuana marina]|uniref:TonB-dependent receptor n=1 Tax=Yeosuana marina TaxID=1565536 RepID=UPI0030C8C0BD
MKHIINLMLLMATTLLYSQNTLDGTVIDNDTKEAIAFANVYFPTLEKGVSTNDDGSFTIENIPTGTYKIIVSFIGYETQSLNITIPTKEPLSILMKPSALEMEEVIVSTPFHKLQSENVMKVERQTVNELEQKGAVNLSEGITQIPGVESVTTGLSIGKPVIRGLSYNRVLVYTQGVRLENQQFGDEHGLGINSSGIESVEVIKGPASLLYGSDALGGVLYLNPEKFANANKSAADFGGKYYSNTLGYSTNAGYKSSDDHWQFLFRGNLAEHSDYNTKDYRVTNSRFREQDFKAGVGYLGTKFKTEFRYNLNFLKPGLTEEIGVQSKRRAPLLGFQEIGNHVFSSKSNVFFNNSSLDVNLGYIYNDRKEFSEELGYNQAGLHLKLKTFNYDVKYNMPKLGKFETIVGVQGMDQTNGTYGEEFLIPNARVNDFGVLAVSHIHFEKADVQLGARFDNRNIDNTDSGEKRQFNSFNGAAGVKTDIAKNLTARVNLASGFRAPNLAELTVDGVHEGTNRYEKGNIDLKIEQNFQTDVALEYKNKHIEFYANGFYNKINDYIFIAPNGQTIDGNDVYVYSQNNANLYGGEVGFHLHPHPLDWLHIESSFETVTGKLTSDAYLPLIPANSINNSLRVEFDKSWIKNGYAFVSLKSTFAQNNTGAFETATSGYNLLSAGLGGSFKLFNKEALVSISGTNLTDKTYINHLSRFKTEGIYNMGRNITFGVTYKL